MRSGSASQRSLLRSLAVFAVLSVSVSQMVALDEPLGESLKALELPRVDEERRQLQAFQIFDRSNFQPDVPLDDVDRSATLAVCTNTETPPLALTTDLLFDYTVETDQATATNETLNDDIPTWVSGAMIVFVATELCEEEEGGQIIGGETPVEYPGLDETAEGGSAAASSSCVLSVSEGTPDNYTGPCTPVDPDSKSCQAYAGSLRITHTDECTSQQIKDDVMGALATAVDDDDFLDYINARSQAAQNLNVTNVDLGTGGLTFAGLQGHSSQSEKGLAGGGIFGVVLAGLVALALAVLFFLQRRRKRWQDDKSYHTDWDEHSDDRSYIKPDFYDLGAQHSCQDSRRCNSALCKVCRPALGQVHMLPVNRELKPGDLHPAMFGHEGAAYGIDPYCVEGEKGFETPVKQQQDDLHQAPNSLQLTATDSMLNSESQLQIKALANDDDEDDDDGALEQDEREQDEQNSNVEFVRHARHNPKRSRKTWNSQQEEGKKVVL